MSSLYWPPLRSCYRLLARRPFRCSGYAVRSYATRSYDDALTHLNTLQTSHKVLAEKRAAGLRPDAAAIQDMIQYLSLIGHSVSDLDKLNVVHVAGTKGKGSTCTYVDSILAQYRKRYNFPKKVGLYTSPHLISVRERIRINSVPISPELFAKYFFEVWDLLTLKYELATLKNDLENLPSDQKPGYFKFLTLMSFHVFLQEGIDVAIYETGIGGQFDSTNIVERPACTGITQLDLDHTYVLGETIEEIAWQKAGIQKTGSPSFFVGQTSHPTTMKVIKCVAKERKVQYTCVTKNKYSGIRRLDGVKVKPDLVTQRSNANLAASLAQSVIEKLTTESIRLAHPSLEKLQPGNLSKEIVDGIEQAVFPGRYDIREQKPVTWYLDGAHTTLSMKVVGDWYEAEFKNRSTSPPEDSKAPAIRVLIFNQQGDRDAVKLLESLYRKTSPFNHVIFCPSASQTSGKSQKDFVNHTHDEQAISNLSFQQYLADKWLSMDSEKRSKIVVLPGVEDAIEYVEGLSIIPKDADAKKLLKDRFPDIPEDPQRWIRHVLNREDLSSEWCSKWEESGSNLSSHVLITGSIHLVGRVLDSLEKQSSLEK